MALLDELALLAGIANGVFYLGLFLAFAWDLATGGFRARLQAFLGISQLRRDHQNTQAFLVGLGRGYNDLKETVSEEHDIPPEERPERMDVIQYRRRLAGEDAVLGEDFYRSGSTPSRDD